MLSVLLLIAAAIAYFYLHKRAVDRQNAGLFDESGYTDGVVTARPEKSHDVVNARASADAVTAQSPSIANVTTATCLSTTNLATAQSSMDFYDRMRDAYLNGLMTDTMLTAISPRYAKSDLQLSNRECAKLIESEARIPCMTARSMLDIRNHLSHATERSSIDNIFRAADVVTAEWYDKDMRTCTAGSMRAAKSVIAVENTSLMMTATAGSDGTNEKTEKNAELKFARDDINAFALNAEDVFKFVNFDRGPVMADPATQFATKTMKKRRRRNKKKSTGSTVSESNVVTHSDVYEVDARGERAAAGGDIRA